jgi:hypothetical protein
MANPIEREQAGAVAEQRQAPSARRSGTPDDLRADRFRLAAEQQRGTRAAGSRPISSFGQTKDVLMSAVGSRQHANSTVRRAAVGQHRADRYAPDPEQEASPAARRTT